MPEFKRPIYGQRGELTEGGVATKVGLRDANAELRVNRAKQLNQIDAVDIVAAQSLIRFEFEIRQTSAEPLQHNLRRKRRWC